MIGSFLFTVKLCFIKEALNNSRVKELSFTVKRPKKNAKATNSQAVKNFSRY